MDGNKCDSRLLVSRPRVSLSFLGVAWQPWLKTVRLRIARQFARSAIKFASRSSEMASWIRGRMLFGRYGPAGILRPQSVEIRPPIPH
jgi:hypothetical protein